MSIQFEGDIEPLLDNSAELDGEVQVDVLHTNDGFYYFYDRPVNKRPQKTKSSADEGIHWFSAVFLVVNAALGAGIINFPNAFDKAGGISVAVVVQVVLLVFVILGLMILAKSADFTDGTTYQEVVEKLLGKFGQRICSVAIIIYCYGTCITFLIIIGDQFDRAIASLYGDNFCHIWYFHRAFTSSLTAVIFILPMCFSKRIDFLKYPNLLGVIAILYLVFVVVFKYYYGDFKPVDIKTKPDRWTDVFLVIPTLCFGYQCHVSSVPIYSCIRNKSPATFAKTIALAIAVCFSVYTLVGCYGYASFGSNVTGDIQDLYEATDPIVLIGILALILKIITTYPILLFCGRLAIDDLWVLWRFPPCFSSEDNEIHRRVLIVFIWFSSTLFVAVVVPGVTVVIHALGSLAAIFIFVFPGLCMLIMTINKDPFWYLVKDRIYMGIAVCCVAVGMFIFGVTFTNTVSEIVTGQIAGSSKLCK